MKRDVKTNNMKAEARLKILSSDFQHQVKIMLLENSFGKDQNLPSLFFLSFKTHSFLRYCNSFYFIFTLKLFSFWIFMYFFTRFEMHLLKAL